MYTLPNNLPGHSRVWVYQSNRKLTEFEENQIQNMGQEFVENWTAHNQTLLASFEIRYHYFLIFSIDQNHAFASGCSIDKSVHFIQKVEKEFGITLLDRMLISYKDGDEIQIKKLNEFTDMLKRKEINSDTIVFNNLVDTKEALQSEWEIPVSKSWHGK